MNKRIQNNSLICQVLIMLAMEMVSPFLPAYIAQLSNGPVEDIVMKSALVLLAPMLCMIVTAPLWGAIGDKYGYKPMLLRAAIALFITQLLTSFVTSFEQLLALRVLQGCFAGFISAMQAYATSACPQGHRAQVLGRLQAATAIATSLSGLVGGVLLTGLGLNHLFQIAAFLCLISASLIAWTLPDISPAKPIGRHNKEPIKYSGRLVFIGTLIVLSQVAKFLPKASFPLYVEHLLTANPVLIGLLYSLPGISIILGASLAGRYFDKQRQLATRRHSSKPLFSYFALVTLAGALLTLAHALSNHLVLIIIIRLGWGLVFAALLPALFSMLSDVSSKQGVLIGLGNSLAKSGNALGLLLGGLGVNFLAMNQIFLLSSLSYAVMAVICMSALWQTKKGFIGVKS